MAKKYLILFFMLFSTWFVQAQDVLSSYTKPIVNPIKKINVVKYDGDNISEINEYLKKYTLYSIAFDSLHTYINSNMYLSEFIIPLLDNEYLFNIQKNDLRSPEYFTSENEKLIYKRNIKDSTYKNIITYKGYANHEKENYIRLTVSKDNFWGYIYEPQIDDFIFFQSLGKFLNNSKYNKLLVVYLAKDIKKSSIGGCELEVVSGNWDVPEKSKGFIDKCTPRYLQIATEADYEYYQKHGQNTFTNILSLLNQVEGIYSANFNLMFEVTFQNMWTTPNDPYNSKVAFERLAYEMRPYWNSNFYNVQRDLALYYTGFSILQNSQGQNVVSGTSLTTNHLHPGVVCKYPNLSYSLVCDRANNHFTTAHEIGHTIDMPHPFDVPNNTECNSNPGIMCYGDDRGFFFNQSSINNAIEYLNSYGQCLGNFQDESNVSPWIKSYSNYRNNRWIGTWFYKKGDQKLVGDFDGDGDEELLFMSNTDWCNMLDYSCNTGSDWYHMWSNMGNRTIGTWYMNNGDRHFTGDFDGNGITDLLSISASQTWATIGKYNSVNSSWSHMWSNMGSRWIATWYVRSTDKFLISDFDDDGKDELLCFSISGWSTLIDYENGQFITKWSNQGNGYIGAVDAHPANRYIEGKFSGTNQSELLTWVNNWVTLLRWNNTTNSWSWIWSQYGADNFANMYILPLNSEQRILSGNFDVDIKDEILNINNTWVATADFSNNNFVQNWNNWASLGYLEDWNLGLLTNEYLTVRATTMNNEHILSLKTFYGVLLVASSYRGNELPTQNKSGVLFKNSEIKTTQQDPSILLYPNPNKGRFNILIKDYLDIYTIKVTDLNGREFYNLKTNSFNTEIDLSNIPVGVYVLTLYSTNNFIKSFKFIKE